MSERNAPARALLAALIDETGLETAPANVVADEVAALGCGSAGLVAFARDLAAGLNHDGASPPALLLHRLAEADEDAAEIDALERADPAAIRARLPRDTVDALVGLARTMGPAERPSRSWRARRWLPAAATALAASLLLVAVLRPVDPAPGGLETARVSPPPAEAAATVADRAGEQPGPSARGRGPTARLALADAGEAGLPAPLVTRLLVVDPNLAPPMLLDAGYGEGGLAGRLADARRASGGWAVVALIGAEGPDGPFEAAIMALPPDLTLYQATVRPPSVLVGLLGDRAHRFALARLPPG